ALDPDLLHRRAEALLAERPESLGGLPHVGDVQPAVAEAGHVQPRAVGDIAVPAHPLARLLVRGGPRPPPSTSRPAAPERRPRKPRHNAAIRLRAWPRAAPD